MLLLEQLDGCGFRIERRPVLRRDDRDLVRLDVDIEVRIHGRQFQPFAVWLEDCGDSLDVERDIDPDRRTLDDLDDGGAADLRRTYGEDHVPILVVEQDRPRHHAPEGDDGVVDIGCGEFGDRVGQWQIGDRTFGFRQHGVNDRQGR
jgi:hypothetical protein